MDLFSGRGGPDIRTCMGAVGAAIVSEPLKSLSQTCYFATNPHLAGTGVYTGVEGQAVL